MKIIIVAASPEKTFQTNYHLNPSDYYIGVDGGCDEIIKRKLMIDLAIGDFDSTKDLTNIKASSHKILTYSSMKDETDLELALQSLDTLKGATNLYIDIYDATGGRCDHEFNNYLLLAKYDKYKLKLISKDSEITYLKAPIQKEIKASLYQTFSLFTLDEATISIENATYPLSNIHLTKQDTYTISNEPLSPHTTITVHDGSIYLFLNKNF